MSEVPEHRPQSFNDFVALMETHQQKCGGTLWFRGAGKTTHRLIPTLYRHRTLRNLNELQSLEQRLMTRFKQRSLPFLTRALEDSWDMLFFMQHYGVPTRLLDWTENPFIGLYFAVTSAPFSSKTKGGITKLTFSSDASLWVLDPVVWNKHALRHQSYDRGILTADDEAIQGYKPLTKFSDMNVLPVALYGSHNSPRIVAQRGAFTIFGQKTEGMEQAFDTEEFPADSLLKIVLERAVLPNFRKSLHNYGITESVVYPDLEGLAREIRRDMGFEL